MRIAIVGAGPGGLAAAHALLARFPKKPEVLIFDGAAEPGGLASGFKGSPTWDWPLERFYHHLFTNDRHIINLTKEVGLQDLLEVHEPATSYRFAGKDYRLDGIRHLLAFPHLNLADKFRMGLVLAYLRWHPRLPWQAFDGISADAWLRSRMGVTAYETLWQPLLEGKFGRFYKEVALAWFAARIAKRTPQLIYCRGGFQAWANDMLEVNRTLGAKIFLKTPVAGLAQTGKVWEVGTGNDKWFVDAVLYTGPPRGLCRLCPSLPDSFKQRVFQESYMGAVVLILALDRSLTQGTYWISIPADADLPFLVMVEHTAMVDRRRYSGQHLYYLGAYVEQDHRFLTMEESELVQEFQAGLGRLMPDFRAEQVLGSWLHRTAYAQPIPIRGFGASRPPMPTPLPGLYMATMSQVWPWDRGTNYAVEMGQRAAQAIGSELKLGI